MISCDFKMIYYDGIGDFKFRVCKLEILEMYGIERLYFGLLKDYRVIWNIKFLYKCIFSWKLIGYKVL